MAGFRSGAVGSVVAGLVACTASAPAPSVGPYPVAAPAPSGAIPDCRAKPCTALGDTCISRGCGAPWACSACAKALVEKPVAFCGCDGKTHSETTIGCPAFEIAHDGACEP